MYIFNFQTFFFKNIDKTNLLDIRLEIFFKKPPNVFNFQNINEFDKNTK